MYKKILAIGAHFDDIELGCGGSLAKHTKEGDDVYAYVATLSGFSNPFSKSIRKNEIAKKEGINAMKILGIKKLYTGKFETLKVEFNDELNVEILKIIEKKKIDTIYTHWHGDIHHDHKAVSKSSMHSGRHVKRILQYRSNWYHSPYDFKGNFYVNISKTWNTKKKSILAHKSEVNRTGKKWVEFFYNEALNAGQRIGVKYAEVFDLVKYVD